MKKRILKAVSLFLFFSLFSYFMIGQSGSDTPKKKIIYLRHADVGSYDKELIEDAQIFTGNVVFQHDSAYMYCDSALLYQAQNAFEAFENVRLEQGDTIFIYAKYLHYDGETQIAKLRENVRMDYIQPDSSTVTLFTDSLNYDRTKSIGYYFEGGMIIDLDNELTSFYGQYSPSTKLAVFNDSVKLINPEFVLTSDTLHYSTESRIATILGPSIIVADSGTIYSSRGWYDTNAGLASVLDRSRVLSGDRYLIGDSVSYRREEGIGEAFGNVILGDTVKKMNMEGHYVFYNEKTEYAFATDSARLVEFSQQDTLFLHADTLEMITVDSTARYMKAYYGVRFYRNDAQGVCDSMQFNTKDSVLYMYKEPILWNENFQLYGDTIVVYMNDSTIEYAHIQQYAFAAEMVDTTYFNQLKSNDMKAFFTGQELTRMELDGNVETIYYPLESDGAMVGLNKTKSGYMTMWLKDKKIQKLLFWPNPDANLYPIPDLEPDMKILPNFFWFDYIRPKNKDDIYQVIKKRSGEIKEQRSSRFTR